jgi:hypothetical protein
LSQTSMFCGLHIRRPFQKLFQAVGCNDGCDNWITFGPHLSTQHAEVSDEMHKCPTKASNKLSFILF